MQLYIKKWFNKNVNVYNLQTLKKEFFNLYNKYIMVMH